MQKTYLNTTEQDDMSITPYLVLESLPGLLKDLLRVAKTDDERDMLLISGLTACSSVMPNVCFRYGHLQKRYYPNLQTFIMAGAASGKGVASEALALVRDIHERVPLLIPGDSTYPAFFRLLAEQNGIGYMHESEGSVITDIWRSGAMSYNTALRKAAEHEPLSRNRVAGKEEIACPRLSLLLTGTFDQFRTLVPSVQNGFFSRLTMLVVRGRQGFDRTIFRPLATTSQGGENLSARMLRLYEALRARETPLEFRLTDEQADTLGTYFEREYGALVKALGDNFHPTIVRMGITTMRIACILSVLREEAKDVLLCSEEDFASALTIASKLLLHAADAYEQIDGARQAAIPVAKGNYQRNMLLAVLPEEFTTGECIRQAGQIGICDRTTRRWLCGWLEKGTLTKTAHGKYLKSA